MAFQEGTVEIVCRVCSAVHIARWYRMPFREPQTIYCKACGGIAYSASGIFEYTEVKLLPLS